MRYGSAQLIDLIDKGLMGKKCQKILEFNRKNFLEYVEKEQEDRMKEYNIKGNNNAKN